MPPTLVRIAANKPKLHEDVRWTEVINGFMNGKGRDILNRAYGDAIGYDFLDIDGEYVIEDVIVGRKELRVVLLHEGKYVIYSIARDAVQVLNNVTPDEELLIYRRADSQQIYLEWIHSGVCVPLKSFKQKDLFFFVLTPNVASVNIARRQC